MRLLKLLLILCVCAAGPASADPLEDALAASQKGDHATAVRPWRLLADQGNAVAQHNLGIVYSLGQGVPQDYPASMSPSKAMPRQDLTLKATPDMSF